jgi:aryl-alcohol dehydrogenase-like predicted oxidoreductase
VPVKQRRLGRSGLFVSELCLGGWTFGDREGPRKVVGTLDEKAVESLITRALERGINFIDTADVYANGNSERLIGAVLKGVPRHSVILSTKVGGAAGPGPNDRGASRARIMDGVKQSLERLQTDHIDLFQIHVLDVDTDLEETLRALDDLVSEGLVRYVGCSNWNAWRVMKALAVSRFRGWAQMEAVQVYYSIAGRDIEREFRSLAEEEKVALLAWSPLAGGLLSGKFESGSAEDGARRASWDFPPVDRTRAAACISAMRPIAVRRGVSVAQIALAYVLAKPFVTSVILGAKRLDQLDDNIAAADVELTAEELAELDQASSLPQEYPEWMIKAQGGSRDPRR